MIVNKINEFLSNHEATINDALHYEVEKLAGVAFKRQFMSEKEDKPYTLRLSSTGKCPRQLAYAYHGYERKGKEIDSRAKIVFFQGDLVEMMIVSLAKLAGCPIVATGFDQATVDFPLDETTIVKGHPDGLIISRGIWLLECKSMSSFAFQRFVKGEVDESYRVQINVYLEALQLDKCVLVGMSKDSGVLHELTIHRDKKIVDWARNNLLAVINSKPEELPDGLFGINDKGLYSWQCLYCSYWGHCWPNAEKVLVNKSYKLKEKKEVKNGV